MALIANININISYLRCCSFQAVLFLRDDTIIFHLFYCTIAQPDFAKLVARLRNTTRFNRNRKCHIVSAHVSLLILWVVVVADKQLVAV